MTDAPAINPDGAQDYLDKLVDSLRNLNRHDKQPLLQILDYLSRSIRTVRREFVALRMPGGGAGFQSATDELKEVVAETARAADTILAAAETVQHLAGSAAGPERAQLLQAVSRIYEACAFQDITGQRITKVVAAVQRMDKQIEALAKACGYADDPVPATATAAPAPLMEGPQLARNAHSQDEIDRLFAS